MEYNLRCQTQFASKNLLLHYFSVNEFIYRSLRQKPQFSENFRVQFSSISGTSNIKPREQNSRFLSFSRVEVWAIGSSNNFKRVFASEWNKFDIFPHEIIFKTISFLKLLTNLPHRRNKKRAAKSTLCGRSSKKIYAIWFARKRCGK